MTIHDQEHSFIAMFENILENDKLSNILTEQIQNWYGSKMDIKKMNTIMDIYKTHMSSDKQTAQIIRSVKEILQKSLDNPNELSKLIDSYLIPLATEKKKNAEVSTPYQLRQDMLNKMPADFWKTVKKVFEPCVGKGGFLVDIYSRFMDGLKDMYPDIEERKKVVVEQCLYFSDINQTNIYIARLLIDPHSKYKLNANEGDTLKLNIKEKWGIDGFDAVIGNPPYHLIVGPRKTKPIWNLFTNKYLDSLVENGYLLFVHPSGWRSPDGVFRDVFDKIMSKNLIYLNMNDFKKGQKTFGGVGTNYDYYLVQNNNNKDKVLIEDIDDKIYNIDLSTWNFIPSGGFELYEKIIAIQGENKVSILHDYSSYETRKSWVSKKECEKHKYPCCYTITKRDGIKCFYSSVKKGHFDEPKVIWSNGLGTYPIVDENGDFGLTQFSYAIVDKENLNNIKLSLENTTFIKLMTYVKFTNNKYNHKVIALFKKNFWREFI